MLTLAIETSLGGGSIALFDDAGSLAERPLDPTRRSAQTLAPTIAELLQSGGYVPRDVQLVAVTIGPGSFTGLRVGVMTAKTFAYAVGCDIIGLNTLEVIVAQVPPGMAESAGGRIHAAIDAQRNELFVAENRVVAVDAWLGQLSPGDVVTGPAIARLLPRLPAGVIAVDPSLWNPQAGTLARLAQAEYLRGRRDDLWKLAPLYIRPSAAEEKGSKL